MNSHILPSVKSLIKSVDCFIFESFRLKSEYLGLYRILYCISTFLIYGMPNFTWLDDSLNYLFLPPEISLANLFTGFPDKLVFTCLSIAIVILFIMLLFGWFTKPVSILLFFALLFCYSFSYSFGKIDHTILWLIIPLIMAFSGWGNTFSLDARLNNKSKENAWAISLMVLLLGFAMFTAGAPKLIGGWLSFNTSATKVQLIFNHFYYGRNPLLLDYILQIESAFFWELLDYLTVIFEFCFLLAIVSPIAFRTFVIVAVFFHLFVFLTLHIAFTNNLLTYLLFINWSIFNPLIKSNAFKKFPDRFFNVTYLSILIAIILLYGIGSIIAGINFEIPSLTSIVAKSLAIPLKDLNTIVLFSIALIITFISISSYFRKHAITNNYQLKVNA